MRFNPSYKNRTFLGRCVKLVNKTGRLVLERVGTSWRAKKLSPHMFCSEAEAQEIEDYAHTRWFWVFAAKPFGRRSIAGYFYWLPVYKDFYGRQHSEKT